MDNFIILACSVLQLSRHCQNERLTIVDLQFCFVMNLRPYREHCLNPMFEFSPHKVFHNVFFITPFPLVCQPSGLWGQLEWHRAEGASILELIIPHRPSLLPKRSHYRHNRSPLHPVLVISAGGLDFIISLHSQKELQYGHFYCTCGCIRLA